MHTGTYEYLRVTHGQHTGNIRMHNTLDSTERIKDDKIPHQKIETQKHTKRIEIHQSQIKNDDFEPVCVQLCFLRGPLR